MFSSSFNIINNKQLLTPIKFSKFYIKMPTLKQAPFKIGGLNLAVLFNWLKITWLITS